MQDTSLYQYLLGLKSPWTVSRVHLNVTGQCVDVWAEHPEDAAWAYPHCSKTLPLYEHAEERTGRHLDSCQFQTHLHARIPRVECGAHGVVQVTVRGRRRGRGSHCCSSAWPSTCCANATSAGPRGSCGSVGMRRGG